MIAAFKVTYPSKPVVNLSPPTAVCRSHDISTVARRRNEWCLRFYWKMVPEIGESPLCSCFLSKESNNSLGIKTEFSEQTRAPSSQQTRAVVGNCTNPSFAARAPGSNGELQCSLEVIGKPPHMAASSSFPIPHSQAADPVTTMTINPFVEVFYLFFSL